MAKGGLSKIKCMIKRWHSSSRISRTPSGCSAGSTSARSHGGGGGGGGRVGGEEWGRSVVASGGGGRGGGGGGGGGRGGSVSFHGADGVPPGLHPVYVGKSRRRYLIAADLVDHPMFQNLVDRSGGGGVGGGGGGGGTVVGCEVVLFEHLLWMLENADPQPESLDELVEYYAC